MERQRSGVSSQNNSGGYQQEQGPPLSSLYYSSPVSGGLPSYTTTASKRRPRRTVQRQNGPLLQLSKKLFQQCCSTKRKRRRNRQKSSNVPLLLGICVTPLTITMLFVVLFYKRIETPEPLLSPQQVNEVHHAQELHHLHLLEEMEELQQHEHKYEHHEHELLLQHEHHHDKEEQSDSSFSNATNSTTHPFAIPNVVIFTHSINLLTTNVTDHDSETKVLQKNVRRTIRKHKHAQVRFLTNYDCIVSIQNVLGQDSPLVDYFELESEGMYKADICRGAALYETGGLYFDVDLHVRMPVWDALQRNATTFVVPQVHLASKHRGSFFQAFIGATPRHPILYRYLELFVQHYQGKLSKDLTDTPLGVVLLKMAYNDIVTDGKDQVELWQEVLYKREWFPHVKPPNYGTRRACHFVVVSNRKPPFVVPFYSRVKGSRMCGGKDSDKKGNDKKTEKHKQKKQ